MCQERVRQLVSLFYGEKARRRNRVTGEDAPRLVLVSSGATAATAKELYPLVLEDGVRDKDVAVVCDPSLEVFKVSWRQIDSCFFFFFFFFPFFFFSLLVDRDPILSN